MKPNHRAVVAALEQNISKSKTPVNKDQQNLRDLRDESERDATWDDHRNFGDKIEAMARRAGYEQYASRVRDCATSLFYGPKVDMETGEIGLRLKSAHFCHFRHCPICQWRRSMRNKARFLERVEEVQAAFPKARWLMLTLTVRNCALVDLRATILAMNKAWKRLLLRPEFVQVT
ncbi:MAG: protein rep, partial [Candidatus Igneacidithiobacillus chanchocoensis]